MRLERLEQEVKGQSTAQLTGDPSPYTAKSGGGRSEKKAAIHAYEKEIGSDHRYFSPSMVDLKSPVLETASYIPDTPSSEKRSSCETKAAELRGRPVLHMAAERKNVSMASLTIEQGVPVNVRDDRGRSALHVAVGNGSYPIAEPLVRSGADVDHAGVSGQTPLHVASRLATVAVLELLIGETRDVDARDEEKSTALHHAVANDHEEAVRVLVGGALMWV
ncbi:hypothetical protein DL771_012022 [Monosporascus sp. 5C6A]|nr:hypothetical protein DL771_012022 [Monosporascus sp. 5C6A]